MRKLATLLLALCSTAAIAADPVAQPTRLDPAWQARAKALLEKAIEIPTVVNRGQMPKMAELIAGSRPSAKTGSSTRSSSA